jgi:hypothetical protein
MKTLCYSIRLKSLVSISDRAYKATAFDGSEDIIPKSQVFGSDYSVGKSEAYWIAAWVLKKKTLQYSHKKQAWFDRETLKMLPTKTIRVHKPDYIKPIDSKPDETLTR